jgi:hypothetical protein
MTDTRRSDLRIANAIRERLLLLRRRPMGLWPTGTVRTIDRMYELLSIHRQVEIATARRLPNAAQRLKAKWDDALKNLTCAIRDVAQHKDQVPPDVRSVRDILQDLEQIRRDYGDFDYFSDEHMLAVTTPRIALQSMDLGRFRIELNILSLGRRTQKRFYEIRAFDLKCAASNGGVPHPHVLYGHLNAREFTEPIRNAKLTGRIADFFNLVIQALQSYDPSTAYVKIEDWHKVFCSQCQQELPDGLRTFCEGCDEWCCERCWTKCTGCAKQLCEGCQSICHMCGTILCSTCMTTCALCGAKACESCLQKGLCPTCAQEWTQKA